MQEPPAPTSTESTKRFPCKQCGAQLVFTPGAQALRCDHCGFVNEIPQSAEDIEELDFNKYLAEAAKDSVTEENQTVKCQACGAEFSVGPRTVSDRCPFCGSNTVIPVSAEVRIRPKSLLPFAIDDRRCKDIYQKWITSRFWAPNALKDYARSKGRLQGMYEPYWTYDTNTTTYYTGMRGEHYYVTETYTEYEDGKPVTKTRQVQKTAWYPASGTVWHNFDDVLVPGSTTLPKKHLRAVENWDLANLIPFQDEYLSGFLTERYNVDLEQGFEEAKGIMRGAIEMDVRNDIGGDEQQITSMDTQYDAITFKHCLFPIWVGAYRYRDKTYQFVINGRSGKISGEAPISAWKVAIAVILGLIVFGTIAYFIVKNKTSG